MITKMKNNIDVFIVSQFIPRKIDSFRIFEMSSYENIFIFWSVCYD